MSQVESPFHAIAAQALDDAPEVDANGTPGSAILDARDRDRELLKPAASDTQIENGTNKAEEKNRAAEEDGDEETVGRTERLASLGEDGGAELGDTVIRKSKKRTNVWTKTTSRKSAKKGNGKNGGVRPPDSKDDLVLLKPFHQEDDHTYPILLSKTYKAEKIDLSSDRLSASGSKGYRMVRATRGVAEGAWFFEILVDRLGDSGHTRLGWSTRRGDIQAPVGYDAHSYAYRDIGGCKVHAALREDYGEEYHEKDVIGFYINFPREPGYTHKADEEVVGYKGQPYTIVTDEPLKVLPGSEIIFFKNGVFQGVAYRDIYDGSYFPSASMYTLPSQDCCKVVFNFGPDFKYPANDLGDRPFPAPMCEASGPGEARAEVLPPSQVEAVVGSDENAGGKQRMAPDRPDSEDTEGLTPPATVENVPKSDGKFPIVKKKEKTPKVLINTPALSKIPKAVESRVNPDLKREITQKVAQTVLNGEEMVSTGISSLKGIKKATPGNRSGSTGLPNQKLVKKVNTGDRPPSVPSQKSSKKRTFAEGFSIGSRSQKGGQNDTTGEIMASPVLPSLKKSKKGNTGVVSSVLPSQQVSKKNVIGAQFGSPGLSTQKVPAQKEIPSQKVSSQKVPSQKGGKKDMSVTKFPNLPKDSSLKVLPTPKGAKKDPTGTLNPKGVKRNATGTGIASLKGSKQDGIGGELRSPNRSNKDVPLPSVQKSKRDLSAAEVHTQLGNKRGVAATESLRGKGSKLDTSGVGLSNSRGVKSAIAGTGSAGKSTKKTVLGSGLKVGKKDVTGVHSVAKSSQKDLTSTGFRPRGLESSLMLARTSWQEGVCLQDVDVVVVESSNHREGQFR